MADLILPLNGEYFDQIRGGTKTEEYRLRTDYWHKRIVCRHYDRIVLTRGYPRGGGIEGETRLVRKWRGYRTCTLTHPHFGPHPVNVFAIDVAHEVDPTMTDDPKPLKVGDRVPLPPRKLEIRPAFTGAGKTSFKPARQGKK